ncbi:MAG: hypothetical protein NVV83_14410 [Afipia sp.]|nr:hypothetical protein [Afipia sp.]
MTPRLKVHICRAQQIACLPQLHIVAAERRAAIARDKAGRVQAGARIPNALLQRQPHQRLIARQKDFAFLLCIPV